MPNEKQVGNRFLFNGSAVAFSARIRQPEDVFVNAAAPSHLPVIGGLSESTVEGDEARRKHSFKEILTFDKAFSCSRGEFLDLRKAAELTHHDDFRNELPASTIAHSSLEGFTVELPPCPQKASKKLRFHARKLETILESTSHRTSDQVSFRSLTAIYDGLTISIDDGTPLHIKVHTVTEMFGQYDTKQKLMDTYAKDADFRKKYAACFFPPGANLPGMLSGILGKHEIPNASKGSIAATYVTGIELEGIEKLDGFRVQSNRLTIPGFGRLFFGEIMIEENSRRPTALRAELGPCIGGEFLCCECVTNGSITP